MYISWNSFTCKASGSTFRKHTCEQCRAVYGYEMERVVRESSSSAYGLNDEAACARAEANAKASLEDELANGFDLVPCPNCGWYQSRMVCAVRDKKSRSLANTWVWTLVVGGLCLGAVVFAVVEKALLGEGLPAGTIFRIVVCGVLSAILFIVSLVAFVAERIVRNRCDLNRTPAKHRIADAEDFGAVIVEQPPPDFRLRKGRNRDTT